MKLPALLILIASLLGGAFAHAEMTIENAFAGLQDNTKACYAREYSPLHLRHYPLQTVEEIRVRLEMKKYEGAQDAQPMLGIEVKRKGENKVWTNNIFCMNYPEHKDVLCAVECDGGSVEILSRNANGDLMLRNNNVLLYGGCGDDTDENNMIILKSRRGGDDVFRLPAVESERCDSMSEEGH